MNGTVGINIFSYFPPNRFLQDSRQTQLILPYTNDGENDKLVDLAKLYSLKMEIENGRAIFYKTMYDSNYFFYTFVAIVSRNINQFHLTFLSYFMQ